MQPSRKWLAVVVIVILVGAGAWRLTSSDNDGDEHPEQGSNKSAKQGLVGSWFGSDQTSGDARSAENATSGTEAKANELPNLNADAGELSTTLEVVVRDKSDKRVQAANVSVYYLGARDTLTHQRPFKLAGKRVTDSNGVIELKVPSGNFTVSAKAGGPSALKQITVAAGTVRTRVDLQLQDGHLVNLLCVEATSAKPVPLCQVTLKPRSIETPSLEHYRGEADANARLQLGPLSSGPYQAEVTAPGFAKLRTSLSVPVTTDPVQLRLKAAATLAGKVLDSNGKEVAGATVQLVGAYSPQTTTTGSAGGFTFDVSEAEYSLSARKDGAAGALPRTVFATAGETKSDLVITLGTAASLSGKVVDKKTQQAVEGAEVAASPFGEDGDSGRTSSKADGTFELTGLAAGSYDVEVRKDNYARAMKTGITVEAAQNFPLVFELEETGKVTGVVSDESGAPLAGINVAIKWRPGGSTMTGPDGRYTLAGLDTGFGTFVEVHRDGEDSSVSKRVQAKPGETAVLDFVLPGVGYVSGTVTTPEGAPANNVTVMAFVPGVGFRGGGDNQVNVDSAGAYELRLTKGDYAIVVVEPSAKSLPKIQERFSLTVGERKQINLKTAKPEENDLEGEVREADGRPAGHTPLTIEGRFASPAERERNSSKRSRSAGEGLSHCEYASCACFRRSLFGPAECRFTAADCRRR
jgi:hypothetical protein